MYNICAAQERLRVDAAGNEVPNSIIAFFKDEKDNKAIESILESDVEIEHIKEEIKPLKGLTFVFICAMKIMGRNKARKKLKPSMPRLLHL